MICQSIQDGAWVALDGETFYDTCTKDPADGTENDAGKPAKYELTVRVRFTTPEYLVFPEAVTSEAGRVSTRVDDEDQWWLDLELGYPWDGPSGPSPDNPRTCVGALSHDGMYTLLRQGLLNPWGRFRQLADRWYRDLLRQFGAGWLLGFLSCWVLRIGGGGAARRRQAPFSAASSPDGD